MGTDLDRRKFSNALMKYGMWVCCAAMLLPVVGLLVVSDADNGVTQRIAIFIPILLCIAAHLVMFKTMGKSCHGNSDDIRTTENRIVDANRKSYQLIDPSDNLKQ